MIDLIYCAGGNHEMTRIAYSTGWLLGVRSDHSTLPLPQSFIDINYKRPDFEHHVEVVARYRPKYATVPDLSDERVDYGDIERAIKQAERLQPYCEIPLIVPKLSRQLDIIPPTYALGYSIPSSYGGAQFMPYELANRRIHLLGGSPQKQIALYLHLSGIATIMSADGNYAQMVATRYGRYYDHQKRTWAKHPGVATKEKDIYIDCWRRSCISIMEMWRSIATR